MKQLAYTLKTILFIAAVIVLPAQSATFSSTKVELLKGFDYKRGPNFSETDEAILTIANATGFTWGDSFFFLDTTNVDDSDATGGTHIEFGPRLRLWQPTESGLIKSFYGIVQADITSNRFTQKVTKMAGLSADWNVPGFVFLKTHLQYRDDPVLAGNSVQFNLVWLKKFKLGEQSFTFEGFFDWTSSEGTAEANILTQPQLVWHANKNLAVGIEYQYWKNRLGIDGLDEKSPQIMVRWTF